MSGIKEFLKIKIKKHKEQKKVRKLQEKLKKEQMTTAYREEEVRESIKQAREKARRDVKAKYRPKPKIPMGSSILEDAMLGTTPRVRKIKKKLRKKLHAPNINDVIRGLPQ